MSTDGRVDAPPTRFALPVPPRLLRALRDGAAPLRALRDGWDPAVEPLDIAFLSPRAAGAGSPSAAEAATARLTSALEDRGHHVTRWRITDLGAWAGADVVVAAGWTTVPSAMRVPDVGARAMLVLEHEPDRLALSAEREWATWALRQDLHALCASPWLAGLLEDRYNATASVFSIGVDHEHYRSLPTHRRDDLVLLHADAGDPQRAAALGLLALEELHERRPGLELALYGDDRELATRFPHRHLGALSPAERAYAYSEATVGLSLSLGVPSPVTRDMLACGLPVVEIDQPASTEDLADAPALLARADPFALADATELLLDDLLERADRSRLGVEHVAGRTWAAAAAQVETGLRTALADGYPR